MWGGSRETARIRTDFSEGEPGDAIKAMGDESKADGGADDAVCAGYWEFEYCRNQ